MRDIMRHIALCFILVFCSAISGCAHTPKTDVSGASEELPPGPALCTGFYVKESKDPMHVYFGTYTKDRDQSIYRGTFDPRNGSLVIDQGIGGVQNPSYVELHPNGKFLYASVEAGENDGITAFAIDADTGALTQLNSRTVAGKAACHVGIDPAGTTAIVSFYTSGSIASFPIRDDGTLGPVASLIQHEGSSVTPRQKGPHAHSVNIDATGRFAIAADLGIDKLLIYRLDPETSELTPHDPPAFDLQPGAGPRHFAFHPSQKFAYVINELDMTMTAMEWDAEKGTLTKLQTVSTLPPEGFEGTQSTAEVVVHPSGKFVYGSNRGPDTLVIYSVDPDTGKLTTAGFSPSGGEEPRNFNIDPTGRWLIACGQNSDDVQVFSIDGDTGLLTAVGEPVAVPMPVCVKFLAR